MKIISMIDAAARDVRSEAHSEIETLIDVIEDELQPIKDEIARLRRDVDRLQQEKVDEVEHNQADEGEGEDAAAHHEGQRVTRQIEGVAEGAQPAQALSQGARKPGA